MLYVVSYPNGVVGVFSSLNSVNELVINQYKHTKFITQVFKDSDDGSKESGNDSKDSGDDDVVIIEEVSESNVIPENKAWVILYKDSEHIAYVTGDRNKALQVQKQLDSIGQAYSDSIDYWELDIDTIPDSIKHILESINTAIETYSGVLLDGSNEIIYY